MNSQYDDIAATYQQTKESPLRKYLESWSFFKMLGLLKGLRVLDLACGEGFYTRQIKSLGASEVIGVDVSSEMIRLAKQQELNQPLGIKYFCNDVSKLPDFGKFDLISAAYLLHYSRNIDQLNVMCRKIAGAMQNSGRFVAINENPYQLTHQYAGYSQYGFNKITDQPRHEGSPIKYSMISGQNLIQFEAYYYSKKTYESALQDAGFSNIKWIPLELSPKGLEEYGTDYWQEYIDNPPVIGLTCELN
ncbi:MAG: methyltransferase domain-containing protein [Pseudomonadota bacterium]|nr:methyltransferase domain-containing protein [Pseudomonadota bacterium]